MPEIDPRGMGINGLLRSDIYGLSSALDFPTLEKIEERDSIRAKQKKLLARGKDLSDKDRLLGFSRDFRDPIEQQFADAMARRRTEEGPVVLTPTQLKEQEKLADTVLDEVLGGEGK
jgi:uncharacterized protein (DUF2461 family)